MTNKEAISELEIMLKGCDYDEQFEALDLAIKALEERPQGEWVVDGTMYRGGEVSSITYRCSLCRRRITWINIESGKTNEEFLQEYPFCHCGADMRGGEE